MNAITVLEKLGYKVDKSMYPHIKAWKEAYDNKITGFHQYGEYNGRSLIQKQRKTLGMPKKACEDWADNLFNDNVYITADDSFQEMLEGILKVNRFKTRFSELIERTFAFGTGALVEFKDSLGTPTITYYMANMIYPLRVENGEVIDCAFASIDKDNLLYLNIHERLSNGSYQIQNVYYMGVNNKKREVKKKGIKEKYTSQVKLFQILKPAISNNIEMDSAMGISCFANAIDEVKSVDMNYDVFDNEIDKGRKRVYVKANGLNTVVTNDGEVVPIFDEKQSSFYILEDDEKGGDIVRETQGELRVDALVDALQVNLNLFGRKAGLGDDYYSFKEGSVYTNTSQVISSNSKFYKTLKKHEDMLLEVIQELVEALYYLQFNSFYTGDTTVDFDDSIVEDAEAIKRQALLEKNAGLIDNVQYYMDVYKMTEEQAIEFDNKIRERSKPQEEPPVEE